MDALRPRSRLQHFQGRAGRAGLSGSSVPPTPDSTATVIPPDPAETALQCLDMCDYCTEAFPHTQPHASAGPKPCTQGSGRLSYPVSVLSVPVPTCIPPQFLKWIRNFCAVAILFPGGLRGQGSLGERQGEAGGRPGESPVPRTDRVPNENQRGRAGARIGLQAAAAACRTMFTRRQAMHVLTPFVMK